MSSHVVANNQPYDQVIIDIVDYALNYEIKSPVAYQTAWSSFMDTVGCGLESLEYEACRKLLGPVVPGLTVENGVKVPGTTYVLDPVQGAFNIGAMIRWLDFNDTWLAAEWGHPSDNLGGILATADWLSRTTAKKFTIKSNLDRYHLPLPVMNGYFKQVTPTKTISDSESRDYSLNKLTEFKKNGCKIFVIEYDPIDNRRMAPVWDLFINSTD